MSDDTLSNQYSKDLEAVYEQNTKPVTITLTAIEVFAIVSAVEVSEIAVPASSDLLACAKAAAKKMQVCLDPNSSLFLHLKNGGDLEKSNSFSGENFLDTDFPLEKFNSYD